MNPVPRGHPNGGGDRSENKYICIRCRKNKIKINISYSVSPEQALKN